MYTEEEAKGKWCPQIRHGDKDGSTQNMWGPEDIEGCNCIASKCMMWRWDVKDQTTYGNSPIDNKGHCGLAGGIG